MLSIVPCSMPGMSCTALSAAPPRAVPIEPSRALPRRAEPSRPAEPCRAMLWRAGIAERRSADRMDVARRAGYGMVACWPAREPLNPRWLVACRLHQRQRRPTGGGGPAL